MSRIKYRNQCLNCDKVTYTDISEDLTLTALPPRRGSRTLIEGMRCSSIQETSDWLCEGCGVRTTVVRQSFIRDAPEVLLIQINRHAGISNRLATKLIYEENIDLTEFLEPYARQTGESLTYQIYGVICHEGSGTTGGHYTTFVRSPENGWAHINDANVTPATLENALGQNMSRFSGRYAMIPYTLIYLRMPMQSADTGTRLTIDDSLFNSSLNESTVVPIDRPKDIRERNKQSPVQLDSEGSDAELAASFEFIEPDEAPEIGNSPAIKPASAPAPPLVTRWEGQPAEITVKVTMGEMVLSGVLRGVLKRNYRRYASAAYKGSIPPEKPQGITKARTGVRSSSRGPSIKDDGPPEPAQSST